MKLDRPRYESPNWLRLVAGVGFCAAFLFSGVLENPAGQKEPYSAQKYYFGLDHISDEERWEWYLAWLDGRGKSNELQREYEEATWPKAPPRGENHGCKHLPRTYEDRSGDG